MGAVERVLVLGIVVVIVAILGIAVWGAAGDDAGAVTATDGGAVVTAPESPAAPVATGGSQPAPISGIEAWRKLRETEMAARQPAATEGAAPATVVPGAAGATGAVPGAAPGVVTGAGPAPGAGVLPGAGGPPLVLKNNAPALESTVSVQPLGPDAGPVTPKVVPRAASVAAGYTVVAGDSLWKIAHRTYGDADIQGHIDAILAANPKVDPDNLQIGAKLTLPAKVSTDVSRLPAQQQVVNGQGSLYEVRTGDTLSSIARNKLGDSARWKEIYELNRERISDPSNIYVGTTLRLPGS